MKTLLETISDYDKDQQCWTGKLMMDNISVSCMETKTMEILPPKVDVMTLNNCFKKVYINKENYTKESDWDSVISDIKTSCIENGYRINLAGSNPSTAPDGQKIKIRRFRCAHYELYKKGKAIDVDPRKGLETRKRSLMADRKNNRKNGKSMARQTSTTKLEHRCRFNFGVCFDGEGFVFIKPRLGGEIHSGHVHKLSNEIVIRKSELTQKMKDRMVEDAGCAMTIAATQRILNMNLTKQGPFVKRSLVREFRASHVFKSVVDGTIVKIGKHKSDMDIVMELLQRNCAKVAYLAVNPTFRNNELENAGALVSSIPSDHDETQDDSETNLGTFIARTSQQRLGLQVEKKIPNTYFKVTGVLQDSPFDGLIKKGDEIILVNGKDMKSLTPNDFGRFIQSIRDDSKSLRIWRSRQDREINSQKDNIKLTYEEKCLCKDLETISGKDKVFTEAMYEELKNTAKKFGEEALKNRETYELYLGIAYLLPDNYLPALMWGSTVFIDSTFNLCVFSNYRQMSIVYKNTENQAFTIARIGLPHERSFLCTWCLEVVIPALMTKLFPKRVKTIISDGCSWLCNSIDMALKNTFVNARRLRCGWHLTSKNWEENIEKFLVFHKHCYGKKRRKFVALIQNWIYSWQKSTCFTATEYEVSKNLLLSWLGSKEVHDNICSEANTSMIIRWLHTSIFPYEEYYAFYVRRNEENQENYNCCAIEGTHNGLKHNAYAVGKQDTLPMYMKKAMDYDTMRLKQIQTDAANNREKTYLYGEKWMNYLNDNGALLTYNIIRWSEHYISQFLELQNGLPVFVIVCPEYGEEEKHTCHEDTVHIKDNDEDESDTKDGYTLPKSHPRYWHPWRVWLERNGRNELELVCSCNLKTRVGLVCQHIHHCYRHHLQSLNLFESISWMDYRCIWWRISYTLCYKAAGTHTEEELQIVHKLLELADKDKRSGIELRGTQDAVLDVILKHDWDRDLKIGEKVDAGVDIDPVELFSKSAEERLKNWKVGSSSTSLQMQGMVPIHHSIDFGESIEKMESTFKQSQDTVASAVHQQGCKKDLLDMVYDIVERVEFQKHPDFFDRLRKSIDSFHSESITLAGNIEDETDKGTAIFAGSERHSFKSPKKRGHLFTSKTKKKGKRSFNISSP